MVRGPDSRRVPREKLEDWPGPRPDGHPGSPRAALEVWRPNSFFDAGRLGQFPVISDMAVFSPILWRAAEDLGFTWPTAIAALQRLEDLGIAREITGKKRNRLYVYQEQLRILDEGIELKS